VKRLKIFVMCLLTLLMTILLSGCNTNQPPTPQTQQGSAVLTQTQNQNLAATYVGEKTCQYCHQKSKFDATKHFQSFKPLMSYKLDKTYGTVTVYDGASNNAKSTTVDLKKALGVEMDTYVVAQIPKEAGFSKQFYRVGKLVKNPDGTYKIDNPGLVKGTQNWSAGDYSCAKCHSPGMGEAGAPDFTVTCEACHGPGGAHVAATTNEQRIATMVLPNSKTCLKCHTSDPTKDTTVGTTGAIITTNHYGTRDYTFSKHNTTGQINGCLTCHNVHGSNASGQGLKKDNPNDICVTCHAGKSYDVKTIMWENKSDPHGHITTDHSFGAIPESATQVNPTTKNVEITNPAVLDTIKKELPDLFK